MTTEFDISVESNLVEMTEIQKFLKEFTKAFAEETITFHEFWGMLPFSYSEKQVNSVVVPAMYKVTKNVWLEQPFKAGDVQRFLDIATVYKDHIYLIELKHSWNSENDDIAKKTDKEWETAIDQISDLKRNTVKQFVNHKDFEIYRIALMIMPTYVTNDFKHDILDSTSKMYAKEIYNKYQEYKSEKYRANYISAWKVEDPKRYLYKYDGGKQIFPFVTFVAKIEKVFD